MTPAKTPRFSQMARNPWADQWLADAAGQRNLPGADRLAEFSDRPSAWEALVAAGCSDAAVLELACMVAATKPADLTQLGPGDASLLARVTAEKHGVVALRLTGPTIVVATSNPLLATLERDLAHATGRRIDIVTASPASIADAQRRVYSSDASASAPAAAGTPVDAVARTGQGASTQPPRRSTSVAAQPERPHADDPDSGRSHITELVDEIFADALKEGASDLHFEPKSDGLLVRFRVDGGLFDSRRLPVAESAQVVRRIKVLANVDIADSMRPQDGRATIVHEGRSIDLRISTLPLGGSSEKVVVRVLDSRVAERELNVIGYTPRELARVQRLLELPEGLILVTGPTGSGKTSTLYAAVRHVHRSDLNIVTVEDPIEYRIEGINQVQVNEKTRMTFAASLRSILRQDPDVVLIGEMRDAETASIAVKAAMTGHLVLSTLHSSDALSTLDRLYGMDIDTGALAAALKGIVGQRLVRKLCRQCAMPITLADLTVRQQKLLAGRQAAKLQKPVGCAECRGTGYKGRTIVAEIFLVTPMIQRAIARRADLAELSDLAKQCGTLSMWESGLERVLDGTTSLHELLDNVPAPIEETEGSSEQADIDALLAQLLAKPTGHPAPVRPTLPEFEDIQPPSDTVPFRSPSAPVASRAPTRGHGASLRVLVVDDDHAHRRALAAALSREGLAVIEAADGEAALSYARRLHPDVIVTEIALPRLDAPGLLQALAIEGIRARVIVYTRQTDHELHAWLSELGAEDIVPSSVEPSALAVRLRGKVVSVA